MSQWVKTYPISCHKEKSFTGEGPKIWQWIFHSDKILLQFCVSPQPIWYKGHQLCQFSIYCHNWWKKDIPYVTSSLNGSDLVQPYITMGLGLAAISEWRDMCNRNSTGHLSIMGQENSDNTLQVNPVSSFPLPNRYTCAWYVVLDYYGRCPSQIWARFLSLAHSKLRLCSANHRAGYFSNLPCDWLSTVWAYSAQEPENGPWCESSCYCVHNHVWYQNSVKYSFPVAHL